jgi:uncharacterized coiled-coil DUF342 family protein
MVKREEKMLEQLEKIELT